MDVSDVRISTLCSFNDWAAHFGSWGRAGVNRVFDILSIARIQCVYWRASSGGQAEYPSKIAPVFIGRNNPEMFGSNTRNGGTESWHSWQGANHDEFDALAMAVEIGRERGIEVCAWLTIYEEDHGGSLLSSMGSNAKVIQRDRNGRGYLGTADFFYPEVREYKAKIVRELLDRGVKGLLLDFVRHNATPSADAKGVHRFGYNDEIRRHFKKLHKVDPVDLAADDSRWLAYKTRYQTDFIREIFRMVGPARRRVLMSWAVDCRRWLCLDIGRLAREKSIDLLFSHSMRYSFAPKELINNRRILKEQTSRSRVEIGSCVQTYFGADASDFENSIEAAGKAGVREILQCESDQLIMDRLTTSVRALHLGCSRKRREVRAKRISHSPTESDWSRQREYAGFYVATGPDRIKSAWKTEFRAVASPKSFHCRMSIHGDRPVIAKNRGDIKYDQYAERTADFAEIRKHYLEALGARLYFRGVDRGHLFVDPKHTGRFFFHFVADRSGEHVQQTNLDNAWKGKWRATIREPKAGLWTIEWDIPYQTIRTTFPKKGERWTFQIMREAAAEREVSSWFITTTPSCSGVKPYEWGDVLFE